MQTIRALGLLCGILAAIAAVSVGVSAAVTIVAKVLAPGMNDSTIVVLSVGVLGAVFVGLIIGKAAIQDRDRALGRSSRR